MNSAIDEYNLVRVKTKDFAKKNLTKQRILNITLILSALLLLGLFDFVNMKFDLAFIKTEQFWGMIAIRGLASTAIYLSLSREATTNLMLNDIEYKDRKKEVDTISLKHRGDELNKILAIYNKSKKVEVYKFNINAKIGELDKEANYDDQMAWLRYSKALRLDKVVEVPSNEYCQNRKLLLDQLTPEYIEDNIDYINIVFDVTYASELTTGKEELAVGKSPMKVSAAKSRSKKIVARVIQFIAISILWSSFLKDLKENVKVIPVVLSILAILMLIFWAIISGIADGKIEYEAIELPKMDFRYQRLKDYVRFERIENKWNVRQQREWQPQDNEVEKAL